MKQTVMIIAALFALAAFADDPKQCPMHAAHMAADQRGDKVMGFSHETTKHSFKVADDGGAIEVRALRADDEASIRAIRTHLQSIAKSFAAGDFAKPEEIHGRAPSGVEVMIARKASIQYKYEELENGGRVRISSKDAAAVEAVHRFLKFQIDEHRTGEEAAN